MRRCLRGFEHILGGDSDGESVVTARGCELEGASVLGGALVLARMEVARARLALLRDDGPEHEIVAWHWRVASADDELEHEIER